MEQEPESIFVQYVKKLLRSILPERIPTPTEELPIFDAKCWREYLNYQIDDVAEPEYLEEILNTPCPFWPDKLIKNTHLVLLIPKGMTAKKFRELIDGDKVWRDNKMYTEYVVEKSHWIIITRQNVPSTRRKHPYYQIDILAETGYCAPAILEIAVAIQAMKHFANYLLFSGLFGHCRCRESIRSGEYSVAILGSYGSAFGVYINDWDRPGGMAGVLVLGYAD